MSKRRDRIAQEIVDRYKLIRAAHVSLYTRVDVDVATFAPEFFYLVNDILEGKPIDESCLRFVNMDRVREFLREDK